MAVFDLPGQQVAVPKIQLRASASVAYSQQVSKLPYQKLEPCTSAAAIAFFLSPFLCPHETTFRFHQSRGLFFLSQLVRLLNTRADVLT